MAVSTKRMLLWSAVAVVVVLFLATARQRHLTWPVQARIAGSELVELSGMVRAAAEGQFWGHNDSGHPPVLFRFDDHGRILQRVDVSGARNIDWEGMTGDGQGNLFIGDFGDNFRHRRTCTIYHVAEPGSEREQVAPLRALGFVYADGRPRDSEALFAMAGNLYVISKERSSRTAPALFVIDDQQPADAAGGSVPVLKTRHVGVLDVRGRVTGADWSPELRQVAVLTYDGVFFLHGQREAQLLEPPFHHLAGHFGVCEAVCYDGSTVVISNEAGMLWRFPAPQPNRE